MDAQQIAIATRCFNGAHDGTMAFPEIVGTLMTAGFEGYVVDYRRETSIYYLPNGESVELKGGSSAESVAEKFDAEGIVKQIKWAQSNSPDYSYSAFCKNVKAYGCAGYMVSFLGRRVLYFGRSAEVHVEYFPQ